MNPKDNKKDDTTGERYVEILGFPADIRWRDVYLFFRQCEGFMDPYLEISEDGTVIRAFGLFKNEECALKAVEDNDGDNFDPQRSSVVRVKLFSGTGNRGYSEKDLRRWRKSGRSVSARGNVSQPQRQRRVPSVPYGRYDSRKLDQTNPTGYTSPGQTPQSRGMMRTSQQHSSTQPSSQVSGPSQPQTSQPYVATPGYTQTQPRPQYSPSTQSQPPPQTYSQPYQRNQQFKVAQGGYQFSEPRSYVSETHNRIFPIHGPGGGKQQPQLESSYQHQYNGNGPSHYQPQPGQPQGQYVQQPGGQYVQQQPRVGQGQPYPANVQPGRVPVQQQIQSRVGVQPGGRVAVPQQQQQQGRGQQYRQYGQSSGGYRQHSYETGEGSYQDEEEYGGEGEYEAEGEGEGYQEEEPSDGYGKEEERKENQNQSSSYRGGPRSRSEKEKDVHGKAEDYERSSHPLGSTTHSRIHGPREIKDVSYHRGEEEQYNRKKPRPKKMKTLYVDNLPANLTTNNLYEVLIEKAETIGFRNIKFQAGARSCYLAFDSPYFANEARKRLDGLIYRHTRLRAQFSHAELTNGYIRNIKKLE